VVLFPVEKALRAAFGTPKGVPWGWNSDRTMARSIRAATVRFFAPAGDRAHFGPCGASDGQRRGGTVHPDVEGGTDLDRDWETIGELREAVNHWLEEYNHRRPHQALNWETPAERRAKNLSPTLGSQPDPTQGVFLTKKCLDKKGTAQVRGRFSYSLLNPTAGPKSSGSPARPSPASPEKPTDRSARDRGGSQYSIQIDGFELGA